MKKMLGVLVLGALCFTFLAATPADAAWPAGKSFGLIDLSGIVYECIDISNSGTNVNFFWAFKKGGATLVQGHTGAGRSSLTATLKNGDFGGFGDWPTRETFLDCNFSNRGNPWWFFTFFPGAGSGSCTATYRGRAGGGTWNEGFTALEIGGTDCLGFFFGRPENATGSVDDIITRRKPSKSR